MGEQQPAGWTLHPNARKKCARAPGAFADARDDGELSIFAALHIGVLRVAYRRARCGVFQKLRAHQRLPGSSGPGELLVQERADGFRVLLFKGQLQSSVGLQSRGAAATLSRERDGFVCRPRGGKNCPEE